MKKLTKGLIAFLALAAFAPVNWAATATFNDRTTFLAAGIAPSSAGIGITAASGSSLVASAPYSTLITDGWAISGIENFDVSITTPSLVYGFGMDVHEPIASTGVKDGCNWTACVDSTFDVRLIDDSGAVDVLVDTVQFNPANDVLTFFGVTSDTYFNRLEIRESIGNEDNEIFGGFVTLASPVPLPAAAWLFGSALLGLVAVARRRAA